MVTVKMIQMKELRRLELLELVTMRMKVSCVKIAAKFSILLHRLLGTRKWYTEEKLKSLSALIVVS